MQTAHSVSVILKPRVATVQLWTFLCGLCDKMICIACCNSRRRQMYPSSQLALAGPLAVARLVQRLRFRGSQRILVHIVSISFESTSHLPKRERLAG